MTLPNKLTMIRIILIPVMIILYYIPFLRDTMVCLNFSYLYLCLLIIFALASFTDFLDGNIARKYNLVTTFGKFADPLADKMLTFTAMGIFLADGIVPLWVFIIILIREFMVSGIRMVMAEKGVTIAAAKLGKYKTATTMVALIILFLSGLHEGVLIAGLVLLYLACALTIISGIEYFYKNRKEILSSI